MQVSKGIVPLLDKGCSLFVTIIHQSILDSERNFLLCLRRIEKKTDLVRTSKCLVEAKKTLDRRKELSCDVESDGMSYSFRETTSESTKIIEENQNRVEGSKRFYLKISTKLRM